MDPVGNDILLIYTHYHVCTTTNITNYEVKAWDTLQYAGKTRGRTIFMYLGVKLSMLLL